MRGILHLIGVMTLLGAACSLSLAGEYVVLGNGFRLHADRHEVEGSTVRIITGDGVTEVQAASIVAFEPEEVFESVAPVEAEAVQATPTASELAALAAKKFSLPEGFVRSVMRAESGFRLAVVSPKGAIGLMQLMPET